MNEALIVAPPEGVRPETGELVIPATDRIPLVERYKGASQHPVSEEQADILMAPVDLHELDILPTGEVYLSQIGYRRRLNLAFRPAGWSLIPLDKPAMVGKTLIQPWALYVRGAFISSTYGEADYHQDNARQTYATAAESLKSNALMRCCKDLGIASECWDRRFTEAFKRDHCVKQGKEWRLKQSPAAPVKDEPQKDDRPQQVQPLKDTDINFGR